MGLPETFVGLVTVQLLLPTLLPCPLSQRVDDESASRQRPCMPIPVRETQSGTAVVIVPVMIAAAIIYCILTIGRANCQVLYKHPVFSLELSYEVGIHISF